MKLRSNNKLAFITLTLLMCVVIISIVMFNRTVSYQLSFSEASSHNAIATQQQNSINSYIASQISNMISMSDTLRAISDNKVAVVDYLRNLENSLDFESIIVVDETGNGILANSEPVNISDSKIFKEAMTDGLAATSPFISKFSGKEVIAAAIMIKNDTIPIGLVVLEYSIETVKKILTGYADGNGYLLIADASGQTIVSTDSVYNSLDSMENAEFDGDMDYDKLLAAARTNEWTGIAFDLDGESRVIEARPLNINDWSIFVVSDDVSASSIRSLSNSFQIATIILALIFLAFIIYVLWVRQRSVKRIETVAYYDELTGLPNSEGFKIKVAQLLGKNPEMYFTMQKMDIRNFKVINELYGHDEGNEVLKSFAQIIKDIKEPTLVCARVNADEFLMFSGNKLFDGNTREEYEDKLRAQLPKLVDHEISLRCGRYYITDKDENIIDMINNTTVAHSMAKTKGSKHIYDYDSSFTKSALRVTEILNKRKQAIENREFKAYLQPKFSISQNKIVGAEALVRWIEDSGKIIYPNDFIPLFEEMGFIVDLDIYILKNVCLKIKNWIKAGLDVVPISVNFSRMHLKKENFVKELSEICDSYGDIRKYIEIELTETAVSESSAVLEKVITQLKEAGFSVAIDDFGAGYSSLGMLKNYTVDTLKLDKSFFDENDDDRGVVVIEGIILMAQQLGIKIVAEGIEQQSQIDFLASIHCDTVQGYFYAKPMSLAEFDEKYMFTGKEINNNEQ